jgi:hypothetical protein
MTLPRYVPETFFKSYGGATTISGSTSAADIGEQRGETHTTVPISRGNLEPYPRRKKRPRDNQSIGKRLDIHITGRDCQARVRAALERSFPHKDWSNVGTDFIIEGVGAKRRVLDCLKQLGGKVTTYGN